MSRVTRLLRNRWTVSVLVLAVVVIVAVVAVARHIPEPEIAPALAQRQPDAKRGAYVATLGDCAACHTAPGGRPYAGGLPLPTPLGTIYTPNITPYPGHSFSRYSFRDFVRLMRFGVTPEGTRLYPAMPYTAYAKVSDEDLQDLFAYLRQDIAPAPDAHRKNEIPWPLSMRWPLAIWNIAFHDASQFKPDPSKGEAWNRGAYLVEGLTHCGTCHTPRGLGFQEKDVSGDTDLYLSGSVLDGGSPINLRGNTGDGLGRWSASDIVDLLRTGRSAHSAVSGAMTEVIARSTQYMTAEDLSAIATYLKSLSPASETGRAQFAPSDTTARTFRAGAERTLGGGIFMDSCAACHRLSGRGETLAFPNLAGNPMVLNKDPSSLIAVILNGSRLPSTSGAPSDLAMPAFGWRYDDKEIAALATFIRSSFGNEASAVQPDQVANLRKRGGTAASN